MFIKPSLIVAAGLSAGIVLASCGKNDSAPVQEEALRPVKTVTIASPGAGLRREFPGVVDAVQKADLSFRIAGKLQSISVKEGDEVEKDQLIAQLDKTDFNIRLGSVRADYERAEADFERAKSLVEKGHISRSDFDKLKAQESAAAAQLSSAQQDLIYTELRAPFSGLIARRYVENFEQVAANQSIVALQDISSLLVKIDLPESVMIRVKPEDKNRTLYAGFDAIPDKEFPLTFKEAATQADATNQTYEVTFAMPAPRERVILPGMTATVTVELHAGDESYAEVYVPAHAVQEDREGRFVFVAESTDGEEAVVRRRNVTIGRLTGRGMEIVSGLSAGDRVVTAGMSQLVEGKRVRLMSDT
jgi:RND family efflux transporter MFP subunit